MPSVGRIRHIPPWEYGWQPPSSFTECCPAGVECCVNHDDEWNYALELPWIRIKRVVLGMLMSRSEVGRSLQGLIQSCAISPGTSEWMCRTAIVNHAEPNA